MSNPNFISAINTIAAYPDRIKKLFLSDERDSTNIFGVNICRNGHLQKIVVDDFFPANKNNSNLIFSSEKDGCLWVQILEKAYAKIYGSYHMITENSMESILKDLTYAPIVTIDSLEHNLAEVLTEAYEKKWIIMAGPGDTTASKDLLREMKLKANSFHEILLVYKLTNEEKDKISRNSIRDTYIEDCRTILKIRNLWDDEKDNKIEWIGDWSEFSDLWDDSFRAVLQFEPGDHCFYMNLRDFKLNFTKIKICKYLENSHYNSIKISQKPDGYALVKIRFEKNQYISNNNLCYISFIQEDKKNSKNYGLSRFILCELPEIRYIKGAIGQDRELTIEIEKSLDGGEYLLFCELDKIEKETPYVISIYSSQPANLEELAIDSYPDILQNIYINCAKRSNKAERPDANHNCFKTKETTQEGFLYIYIENHEPDATYIEDAKCTKFDGLKLLPPYYGTSYHVEVGPNESKIILIKNLELNGYNLISSYQSNFLYNQKRLERYTQEKGSFKKRKDKKSNSEVEIIVYTYKYPFGLCFYYVNNTVDKKLKEKINIINNTNIEYVEHPGANEINFTLMPGGKKFIELRGKSALWKILPSISYNIETIKDASSSTISQSKP